AKSLLPIYQSIKLWIHALLQGRGCVQRKNGRLPVVERTVGNTPMVIDMNLKRV
ncbi:unnamed protein product, partial [marine sediment metagenome]